MGHGGDSLATLLQQYIPYKRESMSYKALMFVSKKTPKNAVTPQVDCTHCPYRQTGGAQTSLSRHNTV